MNPASDALIFDLDGTLWDAAAASAEGWNRALAQSGVTSRVTVADIRSVSGTPFVRCVETLLPELSPVDETVVRLLESHERAMIEQNGGVLYAGVSSGLTRLAGDFQLYLVSNCPAWYLDAFFRTTGLRELFVAWDSHGASGLAKSEMLKRMAERQGLARSVYVGDTQGDRDAADAAGMRFVHARYGFGRLVSAAHDCGPIADRTAFDSFAELVEYFVRDTR